MPRKDELRILCYNVLYDTISCDKFSVFQGWMEVITLESCSNRKKKETAAAISLWIKVHMRES